MALGTPVAAAAAYSAAGGTTVAPAYPAGILATDDVLLFVGQKPSTANGGTVTTPTGWTLRESLTAAGGYGATLGADTGNTNLFVYSWDTPVAGQTGNLTVTVGTNNVCWAFMVRILGGGSYSYGSADGQQAATPTSPMTNALTNGATATNFQAGDLAIWAMCIPTDVTTPAQFSAQSVTATGATFATAVELNEPDSTTGNDIGGYSAYASVSSGSSTAAPSVTVTLAGTLTNVRGPVVMLRVRDTSQALTPNLYTNDQTFFAATVTAGTVTLTPALYTNDQTFYAADVTQTGGAQNLDPSLYTNTQTFFAATVASTYALTPALYTNNQAFYAATVAATYELIVPPVENTNFFYGPTVTQGTTLLPDLYTNTQTFYSATVTAGAVNLAPALYTNAQTFYAPTVDRGTVTLLPGLYTNNQTFYSATVSQLGSTQYITFDDYVDPGYVDPPGYVTWVAGFQPANTFFGATVSQVVQGGGGPGKKGKSKGWANERRVLELSLEQQEAQETLAKSDNKAVKKIAKRIQKFVDVGVDDEIAEFAALQKEFVKLETKYKEQQLTADLVQAAQVLQEFIQDEQDAIDLLLLVQDFDARCVIEATVRPFTATSLMG